MNNITTHLQNFSFNQPAHSATVSGHNTREEWDHAASLFNGIFDQLRAAFPASSSTFRAQSDIDSFRQQWVRSFMENGITTMQQIDAGMRHARKQQTPYMPSPGKFVAWCKDSSTVLGVTTEEAMAEFHRYNRDRGLSTSPERFNWSKPVLYWVITDARQAMIQRCMTESEVETFITRKLNEWSKKVAAGEQVPDPVQMIESKPRAAAHQPSPKDYEYQYMPNSAHMGSVTPAQWLLEEYKRRKAMGLKT
ncbi:replication protein P [Pantoea ananatis]|uniref:replication protein P n=1 Tax=Pantoea ananas TaxID=553 RepID=UPI001B30AED6|nr:replication protein P [Pantoea ananatis]